MRSNASLISIKLAVLLLVSILNVRCASENTALAVPRGQQFLGKTHYPVITEEVASCAVPLAKSVGKGGDKVMPVDLAGNSLNMISALKGWSHINKYPEEFRGLSLNIGDPRYSAAGVLVPQSECENANARKFVLVKKLINWDRQHSNGLETALEIPNRDFSQLDSVIIELKVDAESTVLPKHSQLHQVLGSKLSQRQYHELDAEKYVLGLYILGERPASGNTNAGLLFFIELDEKDFDRWLRLRIPKAFMIPFREAGYSKQLVPFSSVENHKVYHLQLMAETFGSRRSFSEVKTFGYTARNFLGDNWSQDQEEVFKELAFTIRHFALIWRQ